MATLFDFQKLDSRLYDFSNAHDAIKFQIMVEEFMVAVKTTPEIFRGRDRELETFCTLLDQDTTWNLATNVVPEFRLSQDYNTDDETVLNIILRTLKHKRPRAPYDDPEDTAEKDILRKMFRSEIEYIATCGRGVENASEEEVQKVEKMVQKVADFMED